MSAPSIPSAAELFDVELRARILEDRMIDALLLACGCDPRQPDTWPFGDWTFDEYDGSFEFHGTRPDWCPTPAQIGACFAFGFARCWICYTDGTERYYAPGFLAGDLQPSHHGGDQPQTRAARRRDLQLAAAEAARAQAEREARLNREAWEAAEEAGRQAVFDAEANHEATKLHLAAAQESISGCSVRVMELVSKLAASDAARAQSELQVQAASLFIRDVIEALGQPQPELDAIVDLHAIALQMVGQVEGLKAELTAANAARAQLQGALEPIAAAMERDAWRAADKSLSEQHRILRTAVHDAAAAIRALKSSGAAGEPTT